MRWPLHFSVERKPAVISIRAKVKVRTIRLFFNAWVVERDICWHMWIFILCTYVWSKNNDIWSKMIVILRQGITLEIFCFASFNLECLFINGQHSWCVLISGHPTYINIHFYFTFLILVIENKDSHSLGIVRFNEISCSQII